MKERRKKISVFTLMLGALLGMLFGFSMPTQAAYSGGTERLGDSLGGNKALSSDVVYTVTTDTVIYGNSVNNGYYLQNNIATIYIKKGATLSVSGGDASFDKPGKAGIRVDSGKKLIITGGGALKVYGGAGGRGSTGLNRNTHHKHDGGNGGAGGAGGGAAIGTDGAAGGTGASMRCKEISRGNGYSGYSGGTASSCGTIYIVGSVTRSTYSGSNGSGGGTQSTTDRGGSGGGGGGGQGAVAIGTGGAGGGGGGGGATGKSTSGTDPAGGGGGAGASWGRSASTGNKGNTSKVAYSGGSGGSLGSSSRAATINTSIDKLPEETKITVTMDLGIDESEATNTGTSEQTALGTKSQIFYYGASAMSKIDIPKRLGYVFDGYYTQEKGLGDKIYNADGSANSQDLLSKGYLDENDKWVYAKDLKVYAKWVPVTARITLDANGGSGTVTINQDYDKTVNILNTKPRRVGYVFKGYYTQKTGGVQVFSENGEYQEYSSENGEKKEEHITGAAKGSTYDDLKGGKLSQIYKDVTLYAQWKPVEYKIQYYSWSDEEQDAVFVKEQDATYGSMTLLSDDDLGITRKHHTFSGWNTYTEQGWNMYKANHQYSGGLTEEDGGVVAIYAVWDPVGQITISYKAEGGKGVPTDGVAYTGESDYAIPDTIPTRDNYTFVEWNTASDGTGTSYKAGDKITAGTSNITLYAIWKAHPTLTYNLNGGSGYLPMEYHEEGAMVTLAGSEGHTGTLPEKEGCTLIGWKKKDSDEVYTLNQPYEMPESNTILYAVWEEKNLTVTAEDVKDTAENNVDASKVAIVGWNSDANVEEALKSSVKYNEAYAFAVKADDHYDVSKMSVSVSGNPAVRSKKIAGTGENKGYTYYVYKVNNPRADQVISAADVAVKTYFVNLITDGGTCTPLTSYSYGKEVKLPVPVKEGSTFEGWYTDKDFKGEAAKDAEGNYIISATDDTDKTFYAKWEEITYKVVYDANGGSFTDAVGAEEKEQTFKYGETKKLTVFGDKLTQPADAKENGFLGWATDENADVPEYADGQYVSNLTTDKDATITLYAVWDIEKQNISYNLNGGTSKNTFDVVSVNKGKAYTCYKADNLPERTGYIFAGWSDGTTTYTKDNPSFTVGTTDVELTAQWTPVTYRVEFNSGKGGTGESQQQTLTYDEAAELTKLEVLGFTNENTAEATTEGAAGATYSFLGWATDENADAPEYVDAQSVKNLASEQNKQIELYAIWGTEKKQYVSYDANGGLWKQQIPAAEEVTEGAATLHFETVPERIGYTFAGWADQADATEAAYTTDNPDKANITASTTVYAVWKANQYTVAFNQNSTDATGKMDPQVIDYDASTPLTKNSYEREGYIFAGWATEEDGNAVYRDGQNVKNLSAADTNENKTVTLYAVWKQDTANMFMVFFDTTGGNNIDPVSVAKNSELTLRGEDGYDPVPERTGYTFAGWATAPEKDTADVEDTIKVEQDTVLYAVWKEKAASTVTYKIDGEEYPLDANTYYEGDEITVNFGYTPTKTGYIFKGWKCGNTTYTEQSEEKTVVAGKDNLVFEAVWAPIIYTVTFDANNEKAALEVNDIKADYGIRITLPKIYTEGSNKNATAPEGYSFAGWSTQKGSTIVDYKAGETITESLSEQDGSTITLYAVWTPETHVIVLDNQLDDTNITILDVTYGQALPTLTTLPSRKNYTFEGYFTEKGGKGTQYYDGNLTPMLTKSELRTNITLYASWSADKYRVVYQDDKGVELKAYQVEFKSTVTIQSANTVGLTIKDGQKVVWQKDGNEENQYQVGDTVEGGFFKDGEDIGTVYLKASIRQDTQHEVSYNANGGGFTSIPRSELVWDGEKTTVQFDNLPTRDGYVFIGWTTTLSGKTVNYYTDAYKKAHEISTAENERVFRVERDTVLYAMWEPGEYTITYNANGGALKPSVTNVAQKLVRGVYKVKVTADDGEKEIPITLFEDIFTREGYTFEGWATSKKGSAQYEAGEEIQTDIAPATQSGITLYAVWTANTYAVDFKDQDGSVIADEMEVTYGKSYGNLPAVTKTGYTFAGWYKGSYQPAQQSLDEETAGTELVLGDKVTASTKVTDTAAHSLYAVWTPNKNTAYTVKHYKQQLDGTYVQSDFDQLTGETGAGTAAETKSYTGFIPQNFEQETIAADGSTVVKVYYDRKYMDITYPEDTSDNAGMSFAGVDSVLYDGTYTFEVTVEEGYDANTLNVQVNGVPVFGSSKKNADGTVTVTYTVRNATEAQVITADVQPVVTDTFNANGGTFADGKAITTYSGNSGEVIEFKAPERDGYRFAGWAEDAYAKTGSSTVKFKGGVTYYAVWEHDENTYVKFNAENATINGAHFVVVNSKGEHVGTLYDVELPTATYEDIANANHHVFKHWALENKYDATKVTKDIIFKENTDVYAIWTYVIGATSDGSKVIIDDDFTLNADGSVTGSGIGENNKLTIIDKDGKETEIKLPEDSTYTVEANGTIRLTGKENTITRPDGDKITTNGDVTVATDGSMTLTADDSNATVKKATGEEITVNGKDSTITADETVTSKNPVIVKKDGKTEIIVPGTASDEKAGVNSDGTAKEGNAVIKPAGDYTIDENNTVDLGKDGGKVTLPNGKEAEIKGEATVSEDGTIAAPKGTTITVDNKEVEGPAVISRDATTAVVEPAGTDGKGKITGVNEDTQYSTDDGKTWNNAQSDGNGGYEIPDVSGDVLIRNGTDDTTTTVISIGTKAKPEPMKTDDIKAAKATADDAKDGKITGVDPSMEYSVDGGKTWTSVTGNEINELGAGDVLIRTKETRTEIAGEPATVTIGVKTTPEPVNAGKLTVVKTTAANAKDASITGVDSSMEYSTDGGTTWTQVTGNTISGLGTGEVQIRVKETEDANPSEVTKIVIGVKDNTNAPSAAEIKVADADSKKTSNATITGVDSSMEYSKDGGRTWTKVTGNRITGLGVGQIQIRYAENGTRKASAATTITIGIKAQTAQQKLKNKLALNGGLKVSQSGKVITVKWGKVAEADGYDVYVQYCGKKFKKATATVASANIRSVKVKKVNGKKLNLKANYKVYVSAYTVVNGKKITLCRSIDAHVVGAKNKRYSNARNIQIKKSRITLKKGKTTTIKAKTILVNKRRRQLSNKHAKQFRYASSDTGIAKVNSKGKITAKKKGTCTIYVYARNGFAKKIKLTVK